MLVDADEVLRRRDVVVDQRHAAGQRVRRSRRARLDRKVVDQDIRWPAGADHLPVVGGQRLRAGGRPFRRRSLTRNLRPQNALDAQHFVADRVAVAERRQHLVNAGGGHARCLAAPAGPAVDGDLGERLPGRRGRRRSDRRQPRGRQVRGGGIQPGTARSPGLRLPADRTFEILALDDRPRVMATEEVAAVASEPRVQRTVGSSEYSASTNSS